jgi:hypothetical protein
MVDRESTTASGTLEGRGHGKVPIVSKARDVSSIALKTQGARLGDTMLSEIFHFIGMESYSLRNILKKENLFKWCP